MTHAWGKAYVDKLLNYTIASVISQRNLPVLAREFDCEVAILTEESLFDYVRNHPVAQRLQAIAPLRLVPLDDLVGEPWQYGMTLSRAFHRGMADAGPDMTENYFLFLNADFVLADGSYERLIPQIRAGHPVILSPSYCTNGEQVSPMLDGARRPDRAITLGPRALARMILDNRHNTVRAKTVNQNLVHFRYMDQFYWDLDADTLLGFQMPVSLVAMRPEVALAEVTAFWDWGVVYDFCPSKKLTVLGDSDEFLMLELRGEAEHRDLIQFGRSPARAIASNLLGHITEYQVDNARLPLTLHASDVPPTVEHGRRSLERFRDEVLHHLPSAPIDHRGHPQWEHHKRHFAEFQKRRPFWTEVATLRAEIVKTHKEKEAELTRIERDFASRLGILDHRLAQLLGTKAPEATAAAPEVTEGRALRMFRGLLGRMPHLHSWHPWAIPYSGATRSLSRAKRQSERSILFICDPQAPLHRALMNLPAHCAVVWTSQLTDNKYEASGRAFDECFIHMLSAQVDELAASVKVGLSCLKQSGTVTVHIANLPVLPSEIWSGGLARCLIGIRQGVRISFTGSWVGATAIRAFAWGSERWAARARWWPLKLAVSLGISLPLAAMAYFIERRATPSAEGPLAIPSHCTSMSIEIDASPSIPPAAPYASQSASAEGALA